MFEGFCRRSQEGEPTLPWKERFELLKKGQNVGFENLLHIKHLITGFKARNSELVLQGAALV